MVYAASYVRITTSSRYVRMFQGVANRHPSLDIESVSQGEGLKVFLINTIIHPNFGGQSQVKRKMIGRCMAPETSNR